MNEFFLELIRAEIGILETPYRLSSEIEMGGSVGYGRKAFAPQQFKQV